jgi:hypothetical protein
MGLESVYGQPSINWTSGQDYGDYIRHARFTAYAGSAGEGAGTIPPMPQPYRFIDLLMQAPGDGLSEVTPW